MNKGFDDEFGNKTDGQSAGRDSHNMESGRMFRLRNNSRPQDGKFPDDDYFFDDEPGSGESYGSEFGENTIDSGINKAGGQASPGWTPDHTDRPSGISTASRQSGSGRPAKGSGAGLQGGSGRPAKGSGAGLQGGSGRPAGGSGAGLQGGSGHSAGGSGAGLQGGSGRPAGGPGAGRQGGRDSRPSGAANGRQNGDMGRSRPVAAKPDRQSADAGLKRSDSSTEAGRQNGGRSMGNQSENGRVGRQDLEDRGAGSSGHQTARALASRSAQKAAKAKKIRRIVIMAVLEVFVLAGIFASAYVKNLMNSIKRPDEYRPEKVRNEELSPEQMAHMTGYWTVAVFGVDSRDGNVNKGTNADVIMICNLNRDTGELKLVSVFRDTYLNISEKGIYNKINAAYSDGGPEQAVSALNRNLDLNITDYVTFNWKAVADGINLLGGVEDVEISKAEFYYINSFITETVQKTGIGSHQLKKAGVTDLDGVQAVAYGRLRLMDTDYARTERQRLIIKKAFEKVKKADLSLLNQLIALELSQINTNLTLGDFTNLLLDLGKLHIGETGGFPSARGEMKMGKKGDCVIPQTLESNVIELHKFLYGEENYQPSPMVKKIGAKIAADSGMYKKGTNIDHVSTDGGYIPKETTEAVKEKESTEEASTPEREDIVETDADGNPIESESTEESESGETKPGETRPGETKPGESKPGETKPGESRPGETKPGGTTGPGDNYPGMSTPDETTGAGSESESPGLPAPDETKPSSEINQDDSTLGPGVATKPSKEPTTEETTGGNEGPGAPNNPTTQTTAPQTSETAGEIPTVSPLPAA